MTIQPDKLFHHRLDPYRKTPPPDAWRRIEAGLDNHKQRRIWWSAAATLFIFFSAGITLWYTNPQGQRSATNSIVKDPSNENQIEKIISDPIPNANVTKAEIKSPVKSRINHNASNAKNKKAQASLPALEEVAELSEIIQPEENLEVASVPSEMGLTSGDPETSNAIESNTAPSKSKIIYTAEDVNARFLKKINPNTTKPAVKPESGLQKILDIAYDLKYDESIVSDLRQKKNEILSFPVKESSREK